ncbi:TPA: hypothetical protein OVS58_000104 [Shigella sonnei]|nr:hypothetical protein [Shigella sonnei]HCV4006023.1 hypothetical protein [Shigella sonnei]
MVKVWRGQCGYYLYGIPDTDIDDFLCGVDAVNVVSVRKIFDRDLLV